MSVRKLLNPTDVELDQATQILVDAFALNDPKLAHPFLAASSDWDVDLFRLIFRARLEIGAMDESVYAAESEGRMNGVMYLLPPGITFGESKKVPGGPPKYRERMRPETKEWLETILLPFFTGFCTRAWGPDGLRDSMHINLVGVAPRAEKTGVGRALLLAAHEWADAHGVETTLWTQTEKTAKWYEKLGYEVVLRDELEVKGELVLCVGMTRPRRS